MLGKKSDTPVGLLEAATFPLVDALHGRRSRRFALGCQIPDGPFAHASKEEPVPLSELEQLVLLTAVSGNTGWQHLIPHNANFTPHIPNYSVAAGGRTFPSAAGFHTTEVFFTDDNGIYFFPTRDSASLQAPTEEGANNLDGYLDAHRRQIRKLSKGRLHLPRTASHMEPHNFWCANPKGSTLIIPVADAAQHQLANLCYLVQSGACIFDDISNSRIPGIEKYRDIVDIDNPYPLSYVEQMTLCEVTVEVSTACYAGALMLQALGLGGWAYSGLNPFSVLGASCDHGVPGLGFRFDTDDRWPLPNVTGLPEVLEGFCPPHHKDMRTAVDALVERKFGPEGPYHGETGGPYRQNESIRSSAKPHDEQFKECVAMMAQYVFDKYGRFPGSFSSIFTMMYLQAHHLEIDYYDKHFAQKGYLHTHARHMRNWHSE